MFKICERLRQSSGEKWRNGLIKAGVTFSGAVLENTLGIAAGLTEVAGGGKYYDNFVGKSVDSMNNWAQENLPNYATQIEQQASAFSADNILTANFWSDKVLNGVAYSLGSIATMYATGGMGMGTLAARSLGITRLIKNSLATAKLGRAVATGAKLGDITAKTANAGTNSYKLINAAKYLDAGITMSLAESSVEARETYHSGKEKAIARYIEENGLASADEIPPEAMTQIETSAGAMGNVGFALNLAITSGTNMLQFGKMLAPGYKASSKLAKDFVQEGGKFAVKTPKTLFDKFLKKTKSVGKALSGSAEEAAQEAGQFASNIGAQEYYLTEMFNEEENSGILNAVSKSLGETFGTKEGLESMLIGGITGGLTQGAGALSSRLSKDNSDDDLKQKERQRILDEALNSDFIKSARADFKNKGRADFLMGEMEEALKTNDIRRFKTAQYWMLFNQMKTVAESGTEEHYKAHLDNALDLEDKDFKEQFGYDIAKPLPEDKKKIIGDIKDKLDKFVVEKERLDLIFNEQALQGLPAALASKESIDETNNRIADMAIAKDLLLANITFADNIDGRIDDIFEKISKDSKGVIGLNAKSILPESHSDVMSDAYVKTAEFVEEARRVSSLFKSISNPRLRKQIESALATLKAAYGLDINSDKLFQEELDLQDEESLSKVNTEVAKLIRFLHNKPQKGKGLDNKDIINIKKIFNTLTEIDKTTATPSQVQEVIQSMDDALVLTTQRSDAVTAFNDLIDNKNNSKEIDLYKVKKDAYYKTNMLDKYEHEEKEMGYRQMRLARLTKIKKIVKGGKTLHVTISPELVPVDPNEVTSLLENEHYEIIRNEAGIFKLYKVVRKGKTKTLTSVKESNYTVDADGIKLNGVPMFVQKTAKEHLQDLYTQARKESIDALVSIKDSALTNLVDEQKSISEELNKINDLLANAKVSKTGKVFYKDKQAARKLAGLKGELKVEYGLDLTIQSLLKRVSEINARLQEVNASVKSIKEFVKNLSQEREDLETDISSSERELRLLNDDSLKPLLEQSGYTYEDKIKELKEDLEIKKQALEKLIGVETTFDKVAKEFDEYEKTLSDTIESLGKVVSDLEDLNSNLVDEVGAPLVLLDEDYQLRETRIEELSKQLEEASAELNDVLKEKSKYHNWKKPRALRKQQDIDNIIQEIDLLDKAIKNELQTTKEELQDSKEEKEKKQNPKPSEKTPEDVTTEDITEDVKKRDSFKPSFKSTGMFRLWGRHFFDNNTINPDEATKRFYKFNEINDPKEYSIMFVSIKSHPEYFKDLLEDDKFNKLEDSDNVPIRGVYINPQSNSPVDFDGKDVSEDVYNNAIFSNVPSLDEYNFDKTGNKTTLTEQERSLLSTVYYDVDNLSDTEIIDQLKRFWTFRDKVNKGEITNPVAVKNVSLGIFNLTNIWKSIYNTFGSKLDNDNIDVVLPKTAKMYSGPTVKPGLVYVKFKDSGRLVPVSTRNINDNEIQNIINILELAANGKDSVKDADGTEYPIAEGVQQWISETSHKAAFANLMALKNKYKKTKFTEGKKSIEYFPNKNMFLLRSTQQDLLSRITYTSDKGKYPFNIKYKKVGNKKKPYLNFGGKIIMLDKVSLKENEKEIRTFLTQKKLQIPATDVGIANKKDGSTKTFKEIKRINSVEAKISFSPEMTLKSYLFSYAGDERDPNNIPIQTNIETFSERDANQVQFKSIYPSFSFTERPVTTSTPEVDTSPAGITKVETEVETKPGSLLDFFAGKADNDDVKTKPDDKSEFSLKFRSPGISTFADTNSLGMSVSEFSRTLSKSDRVIFRDMLNKDEIKFNCN